MYKVQIRSRHPSHAPLRLELPKFKYKTVIRLGSTTPYKDTIANGGKRIELNNVEAVTNSSNKLLMKNCFNEHNVLTADWIHNSICSELEFEQWFKNISFPIISKFIYGSRGKGNVFHNTYNDFLQWKKDRNLNTYIFEKYYNYVREYRLHVSKDGCFYSCRKMLKQDTPLKKRWYRNDDNCVWILEDNPLFDKPSNWEKVIEESVKALNAVGLDMGAIDLRIQSSKKKKPKFIIVEINSAPSFGEITLEKYKEQIPLILNEKYEKA